MENLLRLELPNNALSAIDVSGNPLLTTILLSNNIFNTIKKNKASHWFDGVKVDCWSERIRIEDSMTPFLFDNFKGLSEQTVNFILEQSINSEKCNFEWLENENFYDLPWPKYFFKNKTGHAEPDRVLISEEARTILIVEAKTPQNHQNMGSLDPLKPAPSINRSLL